MDLYEITKDGRRDNVYHILQAENRAVPAYYLSQDAADAGLGVLRDDNPAADWKIRELDVAFRSTKSFSSANVPTYLNVYRLGEDEFVFYYWEDRRRKWFTATGDKVVYPGQHRSDPITFRELFKQ